MLDPLNIKFNNHREDFYKSIPEDKLISTPKFPQTHFLLIIMI